MLLSREQVVAYRMAAQHLADRLPTGELEAAAGTAPQNTPPGSALLGLRARADVSADLVDAALGADRTLIQVWSLRGSPCIVATADLSLFTTGLLPDDEESWLAVMQGFRPIIEQSKRTATETVDLVRTATLTALDGRVLTKRQLGVAIGRYMPSDLAEWFDADTFSNFTAILVRAVSLTGEVTITPRTGAEATFTRTDQWLGRPAVIRSAARSEVVRRYLELYGPSTIEDFASWAGVSVAYARRSWDRVAEELTQVEYAGRTAWVWSGNLRQLTSEAPPNGIRMLPPYDPYLQQRDRTTVVPDTSLHRRIWKSTGNPGVVLRDGEAIALWRQKKRQRALEIRVEPVDRIFAADRDAIEIEASSLVPFRGCTTVAVTYV